MVGSARKEVSRQLKRLLTLTTLGTVSLMSVFASATFSRKVSIHDGDSNYWVMTINSDTEKILNQVNLSVDKDDVVFRVDREDNSTEITIKRAFDVEVICGEQVIPLRFASGTVEDAIKTSGIDLADSDNVSPDLNAELVPNMKIRIEKYVSISVTADGETKKYAVPSSTVEEALRRLEIPISESDILSVDPLSEVYGDMEISIDRIEYRDKVMTKKIAYKTVRKEANYLNEGETKVSVKGLDGEKEILVKETLKNGEVIASEEIKNTVTTEPVDEVVLVGTKKKEQAPKVGNSSSPAKSKPISAGASGSIVDRSGNTLTYSKVLRGSGTAYTAPAGARTSLGMVPKRGVVAVNPSVIPYGTKMYIISNDGYEYGYCVASDTGGALRRGSALVDLYMDSTQQCFNFGRRTVNVYILD